MNAKCLSLFVLLIFTEIAFAQSEGVSKSFGTFRTRVDACADAKTRAEDTAKSMRSIAATFLNQRPSYNTTECDCSAEKAIVATLTDTWVCMVTVRMKPEQSLAMPAVSGASVDETRVDDAFGSTAVEACVKAKEKASAFVRGITGGVLSSFGSCQCGRENSQTPGLSISCSVDTRYKRPAQSPRSIGF